MNMYVDISEHFEMISRRHFCLLCYIYTVVVTEAYSGLSDLVLIGWKIAYLVDQSRQLLSNSAVEGQR